MSSFSFTAPVGEENITVEELRGLSDAVSSLRPKKVLNEELEELKEDREEYIHVRLCVCVCVCVCEREREREREKERERESPYAYCNVQWGVVFHAR